MEHYLKIFVLSFQFSKNRKALYIKCSHGNALQGYINFGVLFVLIPVTGNGLKGILYLSEIIKQVYLFLIRITS